MQRYVERPIVKKETSFLMMNATVFHIPASSESIRFGYGIYFKIVRLFSLMDL